MAVQLIKRLSILATICAFVILIPGIALAQTLPNKSIPSIIIAQISKNTDSSLFLYTNISPTHSMNTPQQQQQVQAVRQRRNKDIVAILNTSQRAKLAENMRSGDDINQGLKKLNLPPEQKDLINTILELADLKMQAISSRYSL
ncbi:hypothetical protein NWP22_03220 [Anabaenopsis tanganyikae CS-531]|uniref:DUF4168 domain-containing protein n=2 Tax=Anabaenopsis TaxID=110103 RepID=A0ABT6KAL3_9CYAN|nr:MULTISPECIES: hypothetical protein [Anabaenopsis]MDB9540463.1 hypothetical protein [Anabaenopsis arnoldii]MDH6092862.1 hypothetical protein [Anabaenopsis arnoldii]MDH6104892.1 hypothetical protein [Anabaenopsis tanganyikae CS-531]